MMPFCPDPRPLSRSIRVIAETYDGDHAMTWGHPFRLRLSAGMDAACFLLMLLLSSSLVEDQRLRLRCVSESWRDDAVQRTCCALQVPTGPSDSGGVLAVRPSTVPNFERETGKGSRPICPCCVACSDLGSCCSLHLASLVAVMRLDTRMYRQL
eukprot:113674-Rhodomonas_salina.1